MEGEDLGTNLYNIVHSYLLVLWGMVKLSGGWKSQTHQTIADQVGRTLILFLVWSWLQSWWLSNTEIVIESDTPDHCWPGDREEWRQLLVWDAGDCHPHRLGDRREQLAEVHSTVNKISLPLHHHKLSILVHTSCIPRLIPRLHSQTHSHYSTAFSIQYQSGTAPPPCLPSVFPLCVVYPCFNTHGKISQPFSPSVFAYGSNRIMRWWMPESEARYTQPS